MELCYCATPHAFSFPISRSIRKRQDGIFKLEAGHVDAESIMEGFWLGILPNLCSQPSGVPLNHLDPRVSVI